MNGRPAQVRDRFEAATAAGDQLLVPSVVIFELWYGVAHSERQAHNAARLQTFLKRGVEVLAFDGEDGRLAGELRAHLRALGTPIGPYDVLIAGQALRHQATLVTANVREFSRVPGLNWEDWASQ